MAEKKKSVFWRIFLITGIVLFVALGVWLIWLYNYLCDYEAFQPKHFAEKSFNEIFADFDAERIVEKYDLPSEYEFAKDYIVEELNKKVKGKELEYRQVSNGMSDEKKYVVTIVETGEKLGEFYTKLDKYDGRGYGQYEYKVTKTVINYRALLGELRNVSVFVEVPEGSTVILNGETIGEKHIVEKEIPTPSCSYMPEGVRGVYYVRYGVGGFLEEPTVEVKNALGESLEVTKEDDVYTVGLTYDAALRADHSERLLEAAELYAKYSQYDWKVSAVGFNQVAPYFDPDSELYEQIKTVDNNFVIEYDKYEFADMKVDEFYKYDANTFSCRVQYTQKLFKGNEVYEDYIDQTWYLRNVDGKYLVYDMSVN